LQFESQLRQTFAPRNMPDIKLWTLSVCLGLLLGLAHIYGVLQPARFGSALRKFPRYTPAGYVLMILATLWFLGYVRQESISDFASFKPVLFILFAGIGIGACLFVKDFLAVRGLAVVFLLLAKLMVDTAHLVNTEWRLVIVTWAYLLVLAGMWFTVSPWRLRDIINWSTANEQRIRLLSGIRVGFGLVLIILGVAVFRPAEQAAAAHTSAAVRTHRGVAAM
jgi:uncharacterized membrane protein